MTTATASKTVKTVKTTVAQRNAETMAKLQATMQKTKDEATAKAAALKAARAEKAAKAQAAQAQDATLKATVTSNPATDWQHAAQIDERSIEERMKAQAERVQEEAMEYIRMMQISAPKRGLLAWLCGAVTAFATGYTVGLVMNLLLAAPLVSASMFLTVAVWVIGIVVAMYLGSKLGGAVSNFVNLGGPARVIESSGRWVKGLFAAKAQSPRMA